MHPTLLTIILSFLEGLALIISPCILPILPIILAGSLTGSKKRPLGIITGFIIVFALFTFFSRKLVQYSGIDLNIIRFISYGILCMLGIIMISSYLSDKFSEVTGRLTNIGANNAVLNQTQGGFFNGMLFGSLVALIWTPCAGPILAAVIVQTVIQQTNILSFFVVLAFGIGAALPMLCIALFGRTIVEKMTFFKRHAIALRKILGVIIIVGVAYMVYQENYAFAATSTDNRESVAPTQLEKGLSNPYPAPQLAGIAAWINSPPLTLQELKGKVVLIDFWTYSCINCLRTLPYLNDWYRKYKQDGFVIIGVHTPEFDFEKDIDNVKSAVKKENIQYPVALDNQFATWQNYSNQYWPAHYLIDRNGNVVFTHFGEGEYDVTEKNIRYLLGLKENTAPLSTFPQDKSIGRITPETYLGYARAEDFKSPEAVSKDKSAKYTFPSALARDDWALQGSWKINAENIVSTEENAILKIHFHAGKVFIVMGNATQKPLTVKLLLNGENVITEKGKDVTQSTIQVDTHRLYEAIVLPQSSDGILQVISPKPGLEIYTFTFGN